MMYKHNCLYKCVTLVILLLVTLTACIPVNPDTNRSDRRVSSGDIHQAAQAQSSFELFLTDWAQDDYEAMYQRLSSLSQDAISLEDFAARYQNVAQVLTLQAIDATVFSVLAEEEHAEIAYRINYETQLVGVLRRENLVSLVREKDGWRIQWEIGLIFPDLRGGNRLDLTHRLPSRGRILDRAGAPLAAYDSAIAIGLVPGEIRPDQAVQLYQALAEISIYDTDTLARMVEATPADWYLPIVTLTRAAAVDQIELLRSFSGVRISEFRSRFYVDGGVAPHALGYMLFIPEAQLEEYLRLGYRQDERIGASGLEAVFEAQLSGQRGGELYLIAPGGRRTLLAASDPVPGQSITTTLDKSLQMQLQASLGDLRAAVVVMEVDTGRVLALVSNPHFDPNVFDLSLRTDRPDGVDGNLLESYFTNPDRPLLNRATQGQYPPGSIFKVIPMAAALEADLFQPSSTFFCGHTMRVCNSATLFDWTLASGLPPSGTLSLQEGLMRSCNPWFYRIGQDLFNNGMESALSDMALAFGLGALTGIDIPEVAGNIPNTADSCVMSAQVAIGQADVLVTPVQVAALFAAIANGGTLYRPALVERVKPATGDATFVFSPEPSGELPISAENLAAITEALRLVVENPFGTAYWVLEGLTVPVAGKTGTAETGISSPHAWFAGYSRLNDPNRPDIAVAVIVENGGEGSVIAAPIFRRAISLYFSGGADPGPLLPWERVPDQPEAENNEGVTP